MAVASSSSSSSSVPNYSYKYDVFLSFRGEETRKNFVSHLYAALRRNSIQTYIDEKSLERGEEISPALLTAIEESQLLLVIFSKDYAFSRWCLEELVHIFKCKKERGHFVLPIFYHVDPSDIRNQRGSYGAAFEAHQKSFMHDKSKVEKWKNALKGAVDLSGFHLQQDEYEYEFIEKIVKKVIEKLDTTSSSIVADDSHNLVGISKRLEKVESLLCIGSPTVRIVGVCGMYGIGKTTLVETLYKLVSHKFDSCFFTNVKEEASKHDLKSLKEKLFCKLLNCVSVNMESSFKDVQLHRKKVLLVLDDVNEVEQLEYLVEECCFGIGSRIVITSRDKKLLLSKADEIYEVDPLDSNEARRLFYLKAFKRVSSMSTDYTYLAKRMVDYARGNPLAIKVLGSHLYCRSREEWKSTLSKLEKLGPDETDRKVLKMSYDSLSHTEKSIFLDIACFFKGEDRHFIEGILDEASLIGINVLIERSLITIVENHKLWMHDLIQEIGWEIVRQESCQELAMRSRLWNVKLWMHDLTQKMGWELVRHELRQELAKNSRLWNAQDVLHVLKSNKGTQRIEGIFLDMSKVDENLCLKPRVFQPMNNLRLLKICNSNHNTGKKCEVYLHQGLNLLCLPSSLRYLNWWNFPSKTLPSKFKPESLVELEMPYSQLTQLWDGVQPLGNLKHIDLSYSLQLVEIPDLSHASRLESIKLYGCISLVKVPPLNFPIFDGLKSVDQNFNNKRALGSLDLSCCTNLKILPEISGNIRILHLIRTGVKELPLSIRSHENLFYLDLCDCKNLEIFPKLPRNVELLDFSCTPIQEMPTTSIECVHGVKSITMRSCQRLESLPSNFYKLKALKELDLHSCSNLKHFPEILEPMENLDYLCLDETGIQDLPSSFTNIIGLRKLSIRCCRNFKTIPRYLSSLTCLTSLSLFGCWKLEIFPDELLRLYHLEELDLSYCNISEIPHRIDSLFSLTKLYLKGNMFVTIPSTIKFLRSLYYLDISHCENLQSLPKLPESIRQLNANGCLSLETLLTSGPTLLDYRFNSPSKNIELFFCECLKLDQTAYNALEVDFLCRVICTTIIPRVEVDHKSIFMVPTIKVCYPGNMVPKWMRHQSEGSSTITIKLPANWDSANFSGFVACVVLSFEGLYLLPESFRDKEIVIYSALHMKTKCGQSHDCGTFPLILDKTSFSREDRKEINEDILRSDHVFMWYECYKSSLKECDAVEMSFNFFCAESLSLHHECSFKYKVKRCGIHMLYVEKVPAIIKVFNNMSSKKFFEYAGKASEHGININPYMKCLKFVTDIEAVEQGKEACLEDPPTFYDFLSMTASSYDIGSSAFTPRMSDGRIKFSDSNIVFSLLTDPELCPQEVEQSQAESETINFCADAPDQVNNNLSCLEVPLDDHRKSAGPSHDCRTTHEEAVFVNIPLSISSVGDQTKNIITEDDSDGIINGPKPSATQAISSDTKDSCLERIKCFDFCCCSSFLSQILEWIRGNRGQ